MASSNASLARRIEEIAAIPAGGTVPVDTEQVVA
jgi:hypothetical protein